GAIQSKVRVSSRRAVRNNRNRFVCCVSRVIFYLHIQHSRQATQALSTNAKIVNLVEQLEAQFFSAIGGTTCLQIVDIDWVQQGFLCQLHSLLSRTTNTYTQHSRRTPASTHLRHHFQNPIH